MNKDDLQKLGIEDDELIQKIIVAHGKDIERLKAEATESQTAVEALQTQLAEAGATIEGFKKLDVDAIRAAAEEWKTKAEAAEKNAAEQVAALRFNHALDQALAGAKARNPKAVRALLDTEQLELLKDGTINGLDKQLEAIRSDNDFLFESDQPVPKVVAGGNNTAVSTDGFLAAALRGGGFQE